MAHPIAPTSSTGTPIKKNSFEHHMKKSKNSKSRDTYVGSL
jgi:hypothetical protein